VSVATRRALAQLSILAAFAGAMLAANNQQITTPEATTWLVAAGVTAVVSTLVLDSIWWYRIRATGDRPLRPTGAMVVMGVVGMVFALMQWVTTRALELTLQRDALLAAVSAMLGVTVIGVAVILLIQGRQQELLRRNELLERATTVAQAREDVTDISRRMQMALDADIDEALAPARRGIAERLADQQQALANDEWASAAQQLREAAQDTVRPLSRSLWSRTAGRLEPITVAAVLRNIVRRQPFQPIALVAIYVIANFATAISTFGWFMGLVLIISGVMTIVVITVTANAVMRRLPRSHGLVFISAALLLQAGGLLNFALNSWGGLPPYTWFQFAVSTIVGLLVILLTSGAGSLRTHRDDVARTFQSDIDRELLDSVAASRQVAQLARESARVLHGTVQTRLIACAVAIERAAESADGEAFHAALVEAQAVLSAPVATRDETSSTVQAETARKGGLWSGLCSIDLEVAPDVANEHGRLARDVGRVVEEGLSNAIRHGGAAHVAVRVERDERVICVTVTDDGVGPRGGSPGLGSAMLDSVCESWSLTSHPGGARLVARVAC